MQLNEKKEHEENFGTIQESLQHPVAGIIDEEMIKIEQPDEEITPVETITMNWMDEYSQESVMPEPTPTTSKQYSRRGRPRKFKDEDSSTRESIEDQRIRDTVSTTCEYCLEDLNNFKEAKIHYKEMHGVEGYFICCGRKFKQKCRLVDHVNLHYELAYACNICGKSFNSKSYLIKHQACHEVEREFVR